jgi:guanidinobutyrase
MPRFGGPATMMRLDARTTVDGLDAAFIGVPFDIGTSNRSGTRYGPRAVRAESALLRPYNMGTRAAPFDSLTVADLGDVAVDTFNLVRSLAIITDTLHGVFASGCVPLVIGGDHTITLPILRAAAAAHGPVGVVHVDAHADVNDQMFGEAYTHGTWVRRAVEEGLVDPHRFVQVGLRGSGYQADDFDWGRGAGFRVVPAEQCWHHSLAPLAVELRGALGDGPVYVSYDIDSLDPAFAPGTGTPEPAGLTPPQALELIRGLRGVRIIGADMVEVSPPYDTTGNTALLGANILYELLCVLPGVAYRA